jgi:outer membrane protein assembly factor BamD (BamD/ComL family)
MHLFFLLAAVAGLLSGCSSTSTSRQNKLADDASSKSLFDIDKFPEKMKKATKKLIGKGEDPEKARAVYARAEEQYREAGAAEGRDRVRQFLAAAKAFADAADRWPDSALEQDALFLSGESYFFADYYPNANKKFEALLKQYPNSRYLDIIESRRFAIAQYWLADNERHPRPTLLLNLSDRSRPWLDEFGHAVRVYDRIRIDDPTGKLADDATMAAGNAYFAAHRYVDADNMYTDLRKTFPTSEHQFAAHLLGLKAKLLSYQGPEYTGAPLEEADRLLQQIRRQFPQQAAAEQDYLTRAFAEVRYRKAEREWRMASYHERRHEFGAARFYYALVTKNFSDTPFAAQADERLVAIQGRPDVPPQRFEWLVNAFPREERRQPLIATADAPTKKR